MTDIDLDEAVEAAAAAWWVRDSFPGRHGMAWEHAAVENQDAIREAMRANLEVVAPLIARQAWEQCVKAMRHEDGTPVEIIANTNPYTEEQP